VRALRVAAARAATGARTWVYRFDFWSPALPDQLGACHAVEIPFVFDTLAEPSTRARVGEDPPQSVADTTHATWVNFISRGDPGWAPYDLDSRTTGLIDEKVEPVDDPRGDERLLWDGVR
jgi:para-nitrobenzyl esterase